MPFLIGMSSGAFTAETTESTMFGSYAASSFELEAENDKRATLPCDKGSGVKEC
jgi:hypothetical protein